MVRSLGWEDLGQPCCWHYWGEGQVALTPLSSLILWTLSVCSVESQGNQWPGDEPELDISSRNKWRGQSNRLVQLLQTVSFWLEVEKVTNPVLVLGLRISFAQSCQMNMNRVVTWPVVLSLRSASMQKPLLAPAYLSLNMIRREDDDSFAARPDVFFMFKRFSEHSRSRSKVLLLKNTPSGNLMFN